MQQLLHIKRMTGMGYSDLADFLGVTRQVLEKAEKGTRCLSTNNMIKLVRLQACLDSLPENDEKAGILPPGKIQPGNQRETECRYLAAVLQRKLARYESSLKKNMRTYQIVSLLTPEDEGDRLWIQKKKNNIIKKLDKCGTAACMKLRKRVYLLIAEADYISRFVNENQSSHESH